MIIYDNLIRIINMILSGPESFFAKTIHLPMTIYSSDAQLWNKCISKYLRKEFAIYLKAK